MKTKLKLKLRQSLGYVTALLLSLLVMGLGLVGASGQAAAQATDPGSGSQTTPSISTKDSSSGSQQTYTFAVSAVIVGESSLPTGAIIVEVREGNILKARQTTFNVSSVGGSVKSTYQLLYQTNATQADIVFVRASDGSIMHTSPLSWNNAQAGARSFTDEFSWKLLGGSASSGDSNGSAGDQGIATTGAAAVGGSGPLIDIEDTDKPVTVVTGLPDWAMQILGITPSPASASSASTATVVATTGTGNTLGTSGASTITTPGVTATTGKTISGANSSSSSAASGTTAGEPSNNTSLQTGISQQVSTGIPVLRWIFIIVFSTGAIAFLLNFIQQTSFGRRVLSGFGSSSGGGGANSTRRLRPGTLRPSFSFPKRTRTSSSRSDETTSGNGSTNASGVAAHKGKSKAKVGALPIATSVTMASAVVDDNYSGGGGSSNGEVIGSTQGDLLQEANPTTTNPSSSEKINTSPDAQIENGGNKPRKTGAGGFWGRFKTSTIPQSQPQPSSAKNAQAQEEVTSKPSRLGSKGDRARVRPGRSGKGGKPANQSGAEGWETQGLSDEDWGEVGNSDTVPMSATPTSSPSSSAPAPALSRFQSFAPSQPQVEAQVTNENDASEAQKQSVKPPHVILPPRHPQLLNFGSAKQPTFSADGGGDSGDEPSASFQTQAQTLVRDADTIDTDPHMGMEEWEEAEGDTDPKKAQASEVISSFDPGELESQSQDTSEAFTLTTTPHTTAHSSAAPRSKSNGEGSPSPSISTTNPNKLSGSGLVLMPPPGQKIARNRGRTLGMGLAESGFEIEVARLIRSQGPKWLGATSVSVSKQVDLTGLARLVDQNARHKFFTPKQLAYLGNTSLDMVVEVQTLSPDTGQLEVSQVIVVEPDGPSHRRVEQQRKDAIKNTWIKSLGLPIVRLTQVNQLQDQLSQFARSRTPHSLQMVPTAPAPGLGPGQSEHDELESVTGESESKRFIVSNTGIDTSANNSTGLAYSQLELEVAQTIQQEGAGWLGAYEVEVSKRVDPTWFLRAAGITPLNEHKQFSSDQLLYLKHTNLGMVVEVRLSENMTVDYMIVVEVDKKPNTSAFGLSSTDPQKKTLIKNSWVTKLGYPLIRVEDLDQLESAFLNLAEKMAQLGVRPIRANTKGGKVIGNVFRRLGSSGGDKAATATTTSAKGKSKLKPQPKKKSA